MNLNRFIYVAGKFAGFGAFVIFGLQYLWTTRFHFLEKWMPYDRRVAVHRSLGFAGFMVLILHPLLILVFYNLTGSRLYMSQSVLLGGAAMILIIIVAGTTFLGRIWQIRYEVWKKIHWITFIILTAAFIHSIRIGSDLYGLNRSLWFVLWFSHLGVLAGKIIAKISAWSRIYKIRNVLHECPGTTTLIMDKPDRSYIPGQFGFLSLKKAGPLEGWHPFSITSNRDEEYFSMTVKDLGDFTDRLQSVAPGEPVRLNPGFGGFTAEKHKSSKYVMIAGGVGITPVYSILKSFQKEEHPPAVHLVYSVHHESKILFRENLTDWFSWTPGWQITIVVTSQPDWEGIKGRLTPEKAFELCSRDRESTYFLCGPSGMIHGIRNYLEKKGVPGSRIVSEYFIFLP